MVPFIGIASGIGAGNQGCWEGPLFLHHFLRSLDPFWVELFSLPDSPKDPYERLGPFYQEVARKIYETHKKRGYLLSIGGDHSCAIPTWSGVAEAIRPSGELGLLWIDAHMDAHTPETSESGNIHGMPLAALMGYGDPRLTGVLTTKPKLLPENLVLIGIRSYESGEAALLHRLGVRIYFMDEVRKRGLKEVLQEAVAKVSQTTAGYGVSFDLDSLDPSRCPAVGTPVAGGLDPEELLASFSCFERLAPVAFEMVEYNPSLDKRGETARLLIPFLEKAVSFAPSLNLSQ